MFCYELFITFLNVILESPFSYLSTGVDTGAFCFLFLTALRGRLCWKLFVRQSRQVSFMAEWGSEPWSFQSKSCTPLLITSRISLPYSSCSGLDWAHLPWAVKLYLGQYYFMEYVFRAVLLWNDTRCASQSVWDFMQRKGSLWLFINQNVLGMGCSHIFFCGII